MTCSRTDDVFVVVDATALDGDLTARCTPPRDELTGVDALEAAGFSVTGVARFGRSFTCRIDGKPSPDREDCADTPPTSAYWSYWTADAGSCTWTYATAGAATTTPGAGAVEGWSFALDAGTGDAPPPAMTPCQARADATVGSARAASSATLAGGPGVDPWVAAGALVLLVAIGALAARRRRRATPHDGDAA